MVDKVITKNGKKVGVVKGNTYFIRRNEETIFRKYNSVNISEDVLDELIGLNVKDIELLYVLNGEEETYTVSINRFLSGREYVYGKDIQKCVPLRHFEKRDKKQLCIYTMCGGN